MLESHALRVRRESMEEVARFDSWTPNKAEDLFNWGRISAAVYEAYMFLWDESHGLPTRWDRLPDDTRELVEYYRKIKLN